jgi:hypothetical protein
MCSTLRAMPGWRRPVSVAAVLLALAPATTAAQSAGDEQYEDPFGDEQSQSQATPTATPAPAQPAQAPAAPATPAAPAQPATAAPAQAAQLPRTGWDTALPGALGLILLSAGVALRAHVRRAP